MARINFVKGGVALGVGVLNGVLEKNDITNGRTGMLKRWSDLAALIGVVGGAAAQVFNFQTEMAETVELASASLLGKKLAQVAGIGLPSFIGGGSIRMIQSPAGTRLVAPAPGEVPKPAAYRSI